MSHRAPRLNQTGWLGDGSPRTMRVLPFYRKRFGVVSLVDDDTAAEYGYLL